MTIILICFHVQDGSVAIDISATVKVAKPFFAIRCIDLLFIENEIEQCPLETFVIVHWTKLLKDITLVFGRITQIAALQDTDFPENYFNFAAFNDLGVRAHNRDSILTGTLAYPL